MSTDGSTVLYDTKTPKNLMLGDTSTGTKAPAQLLEGQNMNVHGEETVLKHGFRKAAKLEPRRANHGKPKLQSTVQSQHLQSSTN